MPDDAPADVVYLRPTQPAVQVERTGLIAGLTVGVALAGPVGWLWLRTAQVQGREAQLGLFVQGGVR